VSAIPFLLALALPTVPFAIVALVIVCRADRKDLPAIARALGTWLPRRNR